MQPRGDGTRNFAPWQQGKMKPSKPMMKPHKSMRSSPIRKSTLPKKSGHSRSPVRMHPSSSRLKPMPMSMKPLAKRRPPSPRMRRMSPSPPPRGVPHRSVSPMPMDRLRSIKRHKLEKRKLPSPPMGLPPSHMSNHEPRSMSPYGAKYSDHPSSHYPIPKKTRRDVERFESMSPVRRDPGLHMESHRSGTLSHNAPPSRVVPPPRRDDRSYDSQQRTHAISTVVSGHAKEPIVKPYEEAKRYRSRSSSPRKRYAPPSDKSYGPTLHERFSDGNRNEPRLRYSTADLEQITIDIHRNVRDHSPTLRRIVDPSDVKLVRRAGEGHRPIFDREEIKRAPRDLREDAHWERKPYTEGRDLAENYEITRHRFDTHHREPFGSTSGRTLNDRWQNAEGRKDEAIKRDERDYVRPNTSRNFADLSVASRSRDPDYRTTKYASESSSRGRSGYQNTQHRTLGPEPRAIVPVHHKESHRPPMRREMDHVRTPPDEYRSHPQKRYSVSRGRTPERPPMSPPPEHARWRSRSREKLPDFSRRPDKYSHWEEKPDATPRGHSYFEHDNRESYRGRGTMRVFRSPRGFRGRSSYRSSTFRGYRGSGPRGRGSSSIRRGRFSPGLWEHDMYSRSSQDRKSGP